ncbi:MAG: sensor histidine kinase [Verrucomicrobia bacterium]|nr:sensor histidine kinase [Verrucomicrobiota bacterium]
MKSALRVSFLSLLLACLASFASAEERVLTKAIEVRSLSPAEAASGIPVRLRGIVVFIEGSSAIFLQDETSTTFFRMRARAAPPAVGDEIELTSKTRMGLYLPGLDDTTYRLLGHRDLPPGIPAQFDDLYFGRYHYQRVTVEGIVRSVQPLDAKKSVLRLAMGSRVIEVRVEMPPPAEGSLVDHRVRITGLAAGLINTPRRQLVQTYLRVLDWSEVQVVAPAPPVAEVPQVSAEELLAFRVTGLGEQRVRIDGVVTASFGSDQVYLQQGLMAFAVRFGQPAILTPGDRITVIGFPSMERFSASVVDAELLERAAGPPPAPFDVPSLDELYGKPGDSQTGKYDGMLVRVSGTVRDVFKSEEGNTLLVQGVRRTIQARVPEGVEIPVAGSLVRLVGICQVETAVFGPGFRSDPGLVSLRAVLPAGLEVLRTPSWWTPRRLSAVLAALAGVTLLAGGWIAILRRQVHRQTAALRHRIEAEAALAERHRIAREFHDTLEQELAGVSLRLDALATRVSDDKGKTLIAASRNLVTRIQVETRDLISDLRDPAETAGDLLAALAPVAARSSTDGEVLVRIEARTAIPPLPAAIVHDLRMIAREAVNNARKHGRATHVAIEVEAQSDRLRLCVIDNGCGFDAATASEGRRGHFGCAGMRERGRKIGAEIAWQSTLQKGTTVAVTLPLRSAFVSPVISPPVAPRPAIV